MSLGIEDEIKECQRVLETSTRQTGYQKVYNDYLQKKLEMLNFCKESRAKEWQYGIRNEQYAERHKHGWLPNIHLKILPHPKSKNSQRKAVKKELKLAKKFWPAYKNE